MSFNITNSLILLCPTLDLTLYLSDYKIEWTQFYSQELLYGMNIYETSTVWTLLFKLRS